jgi:uncharacterized protein
MSIAMYYFTQDKKVTPDHWAGLLDTIAYSLSVVPLSLAYTSSIALAYTRNPDQTVLRYFAPVGRMALTNYLLQTVISTFLYYELGLGLGCKFGYSTVLLISAGVLLFQMIFSHFWFRIANYGPAEWLWRIATYGKIIPLFKTAS